MNRETHVRFWESAGVKLPRATQPSRGRPKDMATPEVRCRAERPSARGHATRPPAASPVYDSILKCVATMNCSGVMSNVSSHSVTARFGGHRETKM